MTLLHSCKGPVVRYVTMLQLSFAFMRVNHDTPSQLGHCPGHSSRQKASPGRPGTLQLFPSSGILPATMPLGVTRSSSFFPLKFPHIPHIFPLKLSGTVTTRYWSQSYWTDKPKSVCRVTARLFARSFTRPLFKETGKFQSEALIWNEMVWNEILAPIQYYNFITIY